MIWDEDGNGDGDEDGLPGDSELLRTALMSALSAILFVVVVVDQLYSHEKKRMKGLKRTGRIYRGRSGLKMVVVVFIKSRFFFLSLNVSGCWFL